MYRQGNILSLPSGCGVWGLPQWGMPRGGGKAPKTAARRERAASSGEQAGAERGAQDGAGREADPGAKRRGASGGAGAGDERSQGAAPTAARRPRRRGGAKPHPRGGGTSVRRSGADCRPRAVGAAPAVEPAERKRSKATHPHCRVIVYFPPCGGGCRGAASPPTRGVWAARAPTKYLPRPQSGGGNLL